MGKKKDVMGVGDIRRLLAEIIINEADHSTEEWCEENRIDEEVFEWLFEQIGHAVVGAALAGTFNEGIDEDDAPPGMMALNGSMAINSIIGTAFQIGWEAHKQYR